MLINNIANASESAMFDEYSLKGNIFLAASTGVPAQDGENTNINRVSGLESDYAFPGCFISFCVLPRNKIKASPVSGKFI